MQVVGVEPKYSVKDILNSTFTSVEDIWEAVPSNMHPSTIIDTI